MPKIKKKTIEVFEVNGRDFFTAEEAKARFLRCIVQEWADKQSVCRGGEWSQDWVIDEIIQTFPFNDYLEAQKADKQTKRFFLFSNQKHKASGGFYDFLKDFDTAEEAFSSGHECREDYDWHVVDSYTGKIVAES